MTTPITSPHNQHLKDLRRLARSRERVRSGRFVAEGEDLLAAADAAGWEAAERYCARGSGLPGIEVEPAALAKVSALGSGSRCVAVYEQRWKAPSGPVCVYLHGVSDPGNVGTILRGALAFGAGCVAIGPGCADPYGPKAVRASMGAIFAVELAATADPDELPGTLVALEASAAEPLAEVLAGLAPPLTLLVGSEREGLPAELLARAGHAARIPIAGDSLNAAMAATVALYELAGQLRMPR